MSKTLTPSFITSPQTHAEANGHWDQVVVGEPLTADVEHIDWGHMNPGPFGTEMAERRFLQIQFQNGPVKECGMNGVQLTTVLKICLARYSMLNKSFPCRENSLVITKLQEAIMWDEERTAKRTKQGVEGYDRPHQEA